MIRWLLLLCAFPLALFCIDGEDSRDATDFTLRDKLTQEEKFGEDYYWKEDVYGENPEDDPDSMQEYWERQRSRRGR